MLGERPPLFDTRITHGICPYHSYHYRVRLRAGLRKVQSLEGQMRAEPTGNLYT